MTVAAERGRVAGGLVACVLAASVVVGCSKESAPAPTGDSAVPSASVFPSAKPVVLPAPVASGLPDPKGVSTVVNPLNEHAYAGPVGSVRGRVVATGDAALAQPAVVAKAPAECSAGREAYGKLFREGPGRALADVLVAVTGYKGYVPEQVPTQRVQAKDCFFGTRTLALTYGQSIEVASGDKLSYIPELLGEHGQPQLVATPGGGTVSTLYPTRVGRFQLIDNLRLFMTAEVLVVKFATHAVTGADGRFEITGVPVGEVSVNALLPATGAGGERKVTVEANKPTEEIVFELAFDAAEFQKRTTGVADGGAPAPSAAASSSAKKVPPAPSTAASGKKRTAAPKSSH